MPAEPSPEEIPAQVGRYLVQREIARGASGVVYEASDPEGSGPVAIKLLRAERSGRDDERFRLEARATARMQHPNLVSTLEFGYHRERPFLVMELVAGESLAESLVRSGPLTPRAVRRIGIELARGLAHAHSEGVLHRDLKPENLLIDERGSVRLTDFGLAKLTDAASGSLRASHQPTLEGQLVGTPHYMSPEQVDGETSRYDERSDVYGLGATLYALLVGAPPFADHGQLIQLLNAIARKPPRDPRERRPELPAGLVEVTLRCLEKDPARRYPSAAAVERALRALEPSGAAPPARREPASLLKPLAGIALLLFAGAIAGTRLDGTDRGEAPAPLATRIAWRTSAGMHCTEGSAWTGSQVVAWGQSSREIKEWARIEADGVHHPLRGLSSWVTPAWDRRSGRFVGVGRQGELLLLQGSAPPRELGRTRGAASLWVGADRVVVGERGGRVFALALDSGQLLWERALRGRVEAQPLGLDLDLDRQPDHLLVGTCAGEAALLRLADGEAVGALSLPPLQGRAFSLLEAGRAPRVLAASPTGALHLLQASTRGLSEAAHRRYQGAFHVAPRVLRDAAGDARRIVAGTGLGLVAFNLGLDVEWVSGIPEPDALPRGELALVDLDGDGEREIAVALCAHDPERSLAAIYDQQGRLRRLLPLAAGSVELVGGATPQLMAHDFAQVWAWEQIELGPPASPGWDEVALNAVGGAPRRALRMARQLPASRAGEAWRAFARARLGDAASFTRLYSQRAGEVDGLFASLLERYRLAPDQRTPLYAARDLDPPRDVPPTVVPPSQDLGGGVPSVDLETVPYSRSGGVRLRSQGDRGEGIFGALGWIELEVSLAAPRDLTLSFHHQAYQDFGLAWSDLMITLDGSPVVPGWAANGLGTRDRVHLGLLSRGTHRVRLSSTQRSLTVWRLYYARLEPSTAAERARSGD